jgi:hypothetical protein
MEVVLTHAAGEGEVWKCQISLRIMCDSAGTALAEPQTIQFGGPLDDPKMVEKRLRGAQEAILRMCLDEKSIAEFLRDDYVPNPAKNVGFSRNVVRLDVFGPDLVDVTFIDLPGIITNSNKVPLFIVSLRLGICRYNSHFGERVYLATGLLDFGCNFHVRYSILFYIDN